VTGRPWRRHRCRPGKGWRLSPQQRQLHEKLRAEDVSYRAFVRAKVACLQACADDVQARRSLAADRDDARSPAAQDGHVHAGRRDAGARRMTLAGRWRVASGSPCSAATGSGTGRRPRGGTLRRALGSRDLRGRLDRAVLLRVARPRERAARTGGIFDADAAIAWQMAAVETPCPEAVTIDTSQLGPGTAPVVPGESPGAVLQQAMAAIRPGRPGHRARGRSAVRPPDRSGGPGG